MMGLMRLGRSRASLAIDLLLARLLIASAGEIADALGAGGFAVVTPGRHLESLAGPVGAFAAFRSNRHRALEDQQPRVELVRMSGVDRARFHAAIDHLAVTAF